MIRLFLVISQIWAAAVWLKPGLFPVLAMLLFFAGGLICLYQELKRAKPKPLHGDPLS